MITRLQMTKAIMKLQMHLNRILNSKPEIEEQVKVAASSEESSSSSDSSSESSDDDDDDEG